MLRWERLTVQEQTSPTETHDALARAFADAWSAATSDGPAAGRALDATLGSDLAAALVAARANWPGVNLRGDVFARHIGALAAARPRATSSPDGVAADERISTDDASVSPSDGTPLLGGLHLSDLFLACACAGGDSRALELFDQRFLNPLPGILRALGAPIGGDDEVAERLRQKLLVASDGLPPRIATYAGRGPLAAWVAIAAQRIALSIRRGEDARQRAHERAVAEAVVAELDPELRYAKVRYRHDFEKAFRDTLADLGDRDRTLLRLSVVGGLSLEVIGVSYRVNASTVSRWLAKIRSQILEGTMARLRDRLRLSATEVTSIARLLTSQMNLSVVRLLSPENDTRR